MESGVIPPPKRAPRSLVAPPQVLPKEHYSSPKLAGSATGSTSSSNGQVSPSVSDSAATSDDQRRLQLMLKDEQRKVDRLLRSQMQLEEELVHRTELADKANNELKQFKQKRQNTESDLAQTTADFMNCQAKWLQQAEEFSEEIQKLKTKLSTAQKTLENQAKEISLLKERETDRKKSHKPVDSKHPGDSAQKAEQIEFQSRVYIEEAKQLNAKLKRELAEQRSINDRLVVSNEEYKDTIDQYQFLLIEKTVTGDLNQPIGLMSDELTGFSAEILSQDTQSSFDATKSEPDTAVRAEATSEPANETISSGVVDEIVGETGGEISEETGDDTLTSEPKQSSPTRPSSTVQESIPEKLDSVQQRVQRQDFELKSLQNHNHALKVSLENLVGRLLENQGFHRIVEETLSPEMVQSFCARVSSQLSRPSSVSSATGVVFDSNSMNRTNKRVVSLGVDNELPPPFHRAEPAIMGRSNLNVLPLRRQGTSASVSPSGSELGSQNRRQISTNSDHRRTASTYSSSDPRPPSGPGPKPVTPTLGSGEAPYSLPESDPRRAPRVESMSGLRKLRLKD